MKVARNHIIAAIEDLNKNKYHPKYIINARVYKGKDKKLSEFGWIISVLPLKK
jgi:hypothetical protein